MKKIVLISCASKKLPQKTRAEDLYISPLFKLNLKYVKKLNPDRVFILSAKHGLLNLDQEVEPYNQTLNKMSKLKIKEWSESVLESLEKFADLDQDEIIFLAGEKYRQFLIPKVKNYSIPLKGLGIGKQLQFLKEAIK